MISLDTETTGIDFQHGAKPFFVTTCDEEGFQRYWEWPADPLTREPQIPEEDLEEIDDLIYSSSGFVFQNAKFDVKALSSLWLLRSIGPSSSRWPWETTHDTLLMAHLLGSNQPKDLTSLAALWLGVDIAPYEKRLERAVQECRRLVQQARLRERRGIPGKWDAGGNYISQWAIAEAGRQDMPSAKEKTWKYDCWLPLAMLEHGIVSEEEHPEYRTVLRDYSNADSATTIALYGVLLAEVRKRGLEKLYEERRKLLPIIYRMEINGVTLNRDRLDYLTAEYVEDSSRFATVMTSIAESYGVELKLPKGAVNNSLRSFCFDILKLEPVYNSKAKSSNPTLDSKNAIPYYLASLLPHSKSLTFIKSLADKRARDVALTYMDSYRRFWLPMSGEAELYQRAHGSYRLFPSLNLTGTDTLRFSSSNPNEQNISKREGFNLRYAFGPAPGREWWSLDAKNIELRIPAYEAEEEDFIRLFERPDDPPYFGSNHLLIAHLLFPREFEDCRDEGGQIDGNLFKKRYKATLYQCAKNGNFAVQYGAVDRPDGLGTADRTYGVKGAQARIKARFAKQDALNQKWIRFAEKHGYVETLPDKSVDPEHGYPLLCSRSEWGRILSTVPLNYHVQGTAMWWMARAMVKCQEQLDDWRERDGFYGFITMQVHDELVFDFPRLGNPIAEARGKEGSLRSSNLWRIRVLQQLMASCGEDLIPRIPTPVGCEYHAENWSEGVSL